MKELDTMRKDSSQYWSDGKFFDSFEEMIDYLQKFPEQPLDLERYWIFLCDRFKEAALNKRLNPNFSNRTAYMMLRCCTDWIAAKDAVK